MQSRTIDAGEFRAKQQEQWNTAASGWQSWADLVDTAWGKISERLVQLAEVRPGSRVLDVAAGYGEPALTAARQAGPDGRVVATDISAQMLAYGRERAAAARLDNIEFVLSDAVSLDFPPGSFDAALSRWGIIFEPDAEATAARVRVFLKPGAKFAISSWGSPDDVPFLAVPMRTAMQRLGVPAPPPGTPGPLSRPTPDVLAALLEGGGFSDVAVEQTAVTMKWESPDEFTRFIKEIAPPITSMIAPHPPDVQEATWAAISDAMRPRAASDGSVTLENAVLMAVGTA